MRHEWAWRIGAAVVMPVLCVGSALIFVLILGGMALYSPFHFLLRRDPWPKGTRGDVWASG